MPTGHYRFRRSLGNVGSLFRGARPDTYPLFSGLLDQYVGASAAYSLRALAASWLRKDVVEVRRASDNTSKGFNEKEITDGAMVDWVNETVELPLDTASASAAYSLRNLSTSYAGNVVDVRRSSDDAEDSFTAAEVADGTLTDWVNADIDKLNLQTESGGLVGNVTNETTTGFDFSVDNEGSNGFKNLLPSVDTTAGDYVATFDAELNSGSLAGCSVYSNLSGSQQIVEGANSISLTSANNQSIFFFILGTAVADVSITNITFTQTTADGFVSQWYDQSGNDNHATQGTDASQPKIVDAGVLLNKIKFDGVDDALNFTEIDFSTNSWMLSAVVDWSGNSSPVVGSVAGKWALQVSNANNFSSRAINDSTIHNFDPTATITTGDGLFTVERSSDVLSGYYDGAFDDAAPAITASSTFRADRIGTRGSVYGASAVKELIIYNSDQSGNRPAIESNIASYYSITLPTGSNPGSVDGFVSTWYDQSGNTNDAVQATSTSQPKIVDAGVLVTNGIDFDGVDDSLNIDFGADLPQANSLFMVHQSDTTTDSSNEFFDSAGAASPRTLFDQSGTDYRILSSNSVSTGVALTTDQSLVFALYNRASSFFAKNGTATGALSAGSVAINQNSTLGSSDVRFYDGTMDEFIIYNSDQSANRVAIETNINSHYDIY